MEPRRIAIPNFSDEEIKELQEKRRALIDNPVHLPALEQAFSEEVDASHELSIDVDQEIGQVDEDKVIEEDVQVYDEYDFTRAIREKTFTIPADVLRKIEDSDLNFQSSRSKEPLNWYQPVYRESPDSKIIKWWQQKLLGNIPRTWKSDRPVYRQAYDHPPKPENLNPFISKISRPAMEMIIKNFDDFTCMGIDSHHIAEIEGFFIRNKTLYYNPNRKLAQQKTHLSMILSSSETSDRKESKDDLEERTEQPYAKEWWKYLYSAHTENNCNGTKTQLLTIFNSFLNYSGQKKIVLPPLPSDGEPFLGSAKSLPVTLGRITSFIENCQEGDCQAQLNLTPYLNLGSQGAIRVLDPRLKSEKYRCRFVHPLMDCVSSDFDPDYGYMAHHDDYITSYDLGFTAKRVCYVFDAYQQQYEKLSSENKKSALTSIKKTSPDKKSSSQNEKSALAATEKTFWRYIAHHDGMPLSFYQGDEKNEGAIAEIKKIKNLNAQAYLYWCLVELTTGDTFADDYDQEKRASQWKNLCNLIKSYESRMSLLDFSLEILICIRRLEALPPLDLLDKIVTLAQFNNSLSHKKKIEKSFRRLKNLLEFLEQARIPSKDLYWGMRFCIKEQAEQKEDPFLGEKSLFYDFLDRFELIQRIAMEKSDTYQDSAKEKRIHLEKKEEIHFLIQSADTFGLTTEESINAFLTKTQELKLNDYKIKFGLIEIVGNIQSRKINGKKLTCEDDLLPILENLASAKTHAEFILYLKSKYSSLFPENFLNNKLDSFAIESLDTTIQFYIKESFENNEEAAAIIIKIFALRQVKEFYKFSYSAIEKTISLLKSFASFYEHDPSIMTDLLQQILIYDQAHPKTEYSLQQFNNLLTVVLQDGNPRIFEAILYRPDFEKIPALFPKITSIYSTISPWLEKNHKRISRNQAYTAAIDVFLTSSSEELKNGCIPDKNRITSFASLKEEKCILSLQELLTKTKPPAELTAEQRAEYYAHVCTLMSSSCAQQSSLQPLVDVCYFFKQSQCKTIEKDEKEVKVHQETKKEEKTVQTIKKESSVKDTLSFLSGLAKSFMKNISPAPEKKKNSPVPTKEIKPLTEKAVKKILDEKYSSNSFEKIHETLSVFASNYQRHQNDYQLFLINYYENIYEIIEKHPRVKKDLLAYVSCFTKNEDLKGSWIKVLKDQIDCLKQAAEYLDENALCRLLYYSRQEEKPISLIRNIQAINQFVPDKLKRLFYQRLAQLSGEDVLKSDDGKLFVNLCERSKNNSDLCETILNHCYQSPPYQHLKTVFEWADAKEVDAKIIEEKYDAFSRHPFDRLDGSELDVKKSELNKFDETKAFEQAQKFSRHDHLTKEVISKLNSYIQIYKNKTAKEKKQALDELRLTSPIDVAHLTVLLAELLYSVAGQPFNYTQLLVVYSALSSEESEIYQIATGQGKSRISMAIITGKTILGKNIDFSTSSMPLAERDRHDTLMFFYVCGIKTKEITVNTPTNEYVEEKANFIGFSSYQELGIFCNKLEVEQKAENQPRELFLDEADIVYADPGILHFNLAQPKPGNEFKNIEWIYPLLVRFVRELNFKDNFRDNVNVIYDSFSQFLNRNKILSSQWDQLDQIIQLEPAQLEVWIRAAIIAMGLQNKVHFDIEKARNVLQMTPFGLRVVSKALPKINNLASDYAKFSGAVHQCLHARLNIERQHKRNPLHGTSTARSAPYYIDVESDIVFTSTANTLLNRKFYGVTGSYGSPILRQKMEKYYKTKFNRVPEHQASQRVDLPAHIVANYQQQTEVLQTYHDKVIDSQPVIIFNPDDIASEQFKKDMKCSNSQIIDGSLKEYKKKITAAEKSGVTTFSTSVIGRGVDFRPESENGLHEMVTYIPNTSDEIQIFGRAGRLGKPGQTRLVLTLEGIRKELSISDDKKPLEQDEKLVNLFINREAFIKDIQMKKDKAQQDQQTIAELVNGFIYRIESDFAKKKLTPENSMAWIKFKNKLDTQTNTLFDSIKNEKSPQLLDLIKQLEDFFNQRHAEYNHFLKQQKLSEMTLLVEAHWQEKLRHQLQSLTLQLPQWQKTQENYDPANSGQHVVYTKLFAESRWAWSQGNFSEIFWNTQHRKAHEDKRGLRHPDWQAFKRGQRKLFANTRAALQDNLNQEWEKLTTAYLELSIAVNPDEKGSGVEQQACALLLREVRVASQGAGKKDLQLLTRVLEETNQLRQDPNNKKYQSNYNNLIIEFEARNKWRKVKAAMSIVAAALFIGALITVALLTKFAASPIVFYGIKFSIMHIITSMSIMGGTGTALTAVGIYAASKATDKKMAKNLKAVEEKSVGRRVAFEAK